MIGAPGSGDTMSRVVWVLDLDGVVWLGSEPIAGAAGAVELLRSAGEDVLFATNNAWPRLGDHEARLADQGIEATGAVITSAGAAATLLEPGERVFVVGGPGLHEAVAGRGCEIVDHPECDAVISGLDRDLRFESLRVAGLAIRGGARYVLTNPDPTYPTPHGLEPGAGSIGAAITVAGGREPEIGGKPHGAMVGLIRDRVGVDGVMVGDRADTDGAFAAALGYRFGLVLSGSTSADALPVDPAPWRVSDDLRSLVAEVLGG